MDGAEGEDRRSFQQRPHTDGQLPSEIADRVFQITNGRGPFANARLFGRTMTTPVNENGFTVCHRNRIGSSTRRPFATTA